MFNIIEKITHSLSSKQSIAATHLVIVVSFGKDKCFHIKTILQCGWWWGGEGNWDIGEWKGLTGFMKILKYDL